MLSILFHVLHLLYIFWLMVKISVPQAGHFHHEEEPRQKCSLPRYLKVKINAYCSWWQMGYSKKIKIPDLTIFRYFALGDLYYQVINSDTLQMGDGTCILKFINKFYRKIKLAIMLVNCLVYHDSRQRLHFFLFKYINTALLFYQIYCILLKTIRTPEYCFK